VLALLFVPGLVVAGTTLLIDVVLGRRLRADFAHGMGGFRPSGIADEAQRWLDGQS
jgi:hypothetical protein